MKFLMTIFIAMTFFITGSVYVAWTATITNSSDEVKYLKVVDACGLDHKDTITGFFSSQVSPGAPLSTEIDWVLGSGLCIYGASRVRVCVLTGEGGSSTGNCHSFRPSSKSSTPWVL